MWTCCKRRYLYSTETSVLLLAAGTRLDVGVGNTGGTPVTLDLTESGTTEQEGVGTGRVLESEGIELEA